jgi:hypothetical protein
MSNSKPEIEQTIRELAKLQIGWNLRFNKKISDILTDEDNDNI